MTRFTQTLGFLGAGRMATALGRGCVESGTASGKQVLAADPSESARQQFAQQVLGAQVASDNRQVFERSDIIVLAVKPQMIEEVVAGIADHVKSRHLLISIAAGVTLAKLAEYLPSGTRLVRVMPNTPCLIGLGASCYSRGSTASEQDGKLVQQILQSVGTVFEVEESLIDAVTGLSGSGPAFVYRMIEALAAGGVAKGLTEEMALELAAQTARGAAKMVLVTGKSPEELCNQVTSPGGTTLVGLEVLDNLKGPDAFRAAVEAAAKRSIELGQS